MRFMIVPLLLGTMFSAACAGSGIEDQRDAAQAEDSVASRSPIVIPDSERRELASAFVRTVFPIAVSHGLRFVFSDGK